MTGNGPTIEPPQSPAPTTPGKQEPQMADGKATRGAFGWVVLAVMGLIVVALYRGDGFTAVVPTASCVVRSISGKVLWDVLETSVGVVPSPSPGFLQVSGLLFSYKASNPKGSRVQNVTLSDGHDVPKNDPTLYPVVMTDATSRGDDGYPMLAETLPTPGRRLVADVVRDYIARASGGGPNVIGVPAGGRITKIP